VVWLGFFQQDSREKTPLSSYCLT